MHRQEKSSQRRPATFETPLLVSVPEAARLLGIGLTLAWEMVRSGEMPSVRLGRRVLVPRVALERLAGIHAMEGHSQEPLDAADEAQPVVPISCHPLHQDGARRR